MANPLYNAINGTAPAEQPTMPQQPANQQGYSMQQAMSELQANPAQMIKQAGYNVPDEIANNPQASVMHLIQTGQIKSPMMQRIQPMLNMLMGRR